MQITHFFGTSGSSSVSFLKKGKTKVSIKEDSGNSWTRKELEPSWAKSDSYTVRVGVFAHRPASTSGGETRIVTVN